MATLTQPTDTVFRGLSDARERGRTRGNAQVAARARTAQGPLIVRLPCSVGADDGRDAGGVSEKPGVGVLLEPAILPSLRSHT